jgi:hypothetical protein
MTGTRRRGDHCNDGVATTGTRRRGDHCNGGAATTATGSVATTAEHRGILQSPRRSAMPRRAAVTDGEARRSPTAGRAAHTDAERGASISSPIDIARVAFRLTQFSTHVSAWRRNRLDRATWRCEMGAGG